MSKKIGGGLVFSTLSSLVVVSSTPDIAVAKEPKQPHQLAVTVGNLARSGSTDCPANLRNDLIDRLSATGYQIVVAKSPQSLDSDRSALTINGSVNCQTTSQQHQSGFWGVFREVRLDTTATVTLNLQLVTPQTGALIAAIQSQGRAEGEAKSSSVLGVPNGSSGTSTDTLFEQAGTEALDAVLPKLKDAMAVHLSQTQESATVPP